MGKNLANATTFLELVLGLAMLDVWRRPSSLRVAVFAEYVARRTLLS